MKLMLSIFNKSQIVAGFIPEAIKIAELFGCELEVTCDVAVPILPRGLDLWPVHTGPVSQLEITVRGDYAEDAVHAIRQRMAQSFGEMVFQLN